MRKRVIIYWVRRCLWLPLTFPKGLQDIATSACVSRWLGGSRPYGGIEIMAAPPYKLGDLNEVVAALDLIRRTDPRRFARIQRFIKSIFVANYRTILGFYRTFGQICELKKLPIPESLRSVAIYHYASTLVHESTHGLLEKKRFPYTRANRRRIEKLCVREQARFLARFPGIAEKMELSRGYVTSLPLRGTR